MTSLVLALVAAAAQSPTLPALADAVVTKLEQAKLEGPVGLVVTSPEEPLARAVATVTCGRLTQKKWSCEVLDVPMNVAEATARERSLSTVVRLAVTLERDSLVARGDAIETWRNFWSGERAVRGAHAATLAISLPADIEVLTLAAPVVPPAPQPLELKLSSMARFTTVPAALGAGDLDGDKRAEVIVLLADEVVVINADGKTVARAELTSAAAPLLARETFGAIVVQGPRVTVWSSRKARAEVFTWTSDQLKPSGLTDSVALDGLTTRLDLGTNRFLPEAIVAGRGVRLPGGFQATSTRAGVTMFVWPDGSASVGRQLPPSGRMLDVGTGSALADVDGDGIPEVLVSSARTAGDVDELRLFSSSAAETLAANQQSARSATPSWQATLKGRALVMTGVDLDGDGSEEFVFGTWLSDGSGELFVVRRVKP